MWHFNGTVTHLDATTWEPESHLVVRILKTKHHGLLWLFFFFPSQAMKTKLVIFHLRHERMGGCFFQKFPLIFVLTLIGGFGFRKFQMDDIGWISWGEGSDVFKGCVLALGSNSHWGLNLWPQMKMFCFAEVLGALSPTGFFSALSLDWNACTCMFHSKVHLLVCVVWNFVHIPINVMVSYLNYVCFDECQILNSHLTSQGGTKLNLNCYWHLLFPE